MGAELSLPDNEGRFFEGTPEWDAQKREINEIQTRTTCSLLERILSGRYADSDVVPIRDDFSIVHRLFAGECPTDKAPSPYLVMSTLQRFVHDDVLTNLSSYISELFFRAACGVREKVGYLLAVNPDRDVIRIDYEIYPHSPTDPAPYYSMIGTALVISYVEVNKINDVTIYNHLLEVFKRPHYQNSKAKRTKDDLLRLKNGYYYVMVPWHDQVVRERELKGRELIEWDDSSDYETAIARHYDND